MYIHIISHGEQNVTMTFNVSGQGHSAKALKLRYLANCWSYGIVFNMYTCIFTHGEQNVTMTSKVRGQGLKTNAVNSNITQTIGRIELSLTSTPTSAMGNKM